MTPRLRVLAACETYGRRAVVDGCVCLLRGAPAPPWLLPVLRGEAGDHPAYFHRVWGARGLLWAWDDVALPALLDAMDDAAWRVREMAAKVVARNRVGEAFEAVERLRRDPVPRVRLAAARAVARLTGADE